ncbi:hypothetical protein CRENBAI_002331 [Crenichthys baileyi]|uniref:Uncharacterized protein n=1 Tax=Crenichthys baileyi TaxID=28760 RepID=A0AAV9R9K8_9TELE
MKMNVFSNTARFIPFYYTADSCVKKSLHHCSANKKLPYSNRRMLLTECDFKPQPACKSVSSPYDTRVRSGSLSFKWFILIPSARFVYSNKVSSVLVLHVLQTAVVAVLLEVCECE